jgi:hypothetical protein
MIIVGGTVAVFGYPALMAGIAVWCFIALGTLDWLVHFFVPPEGRKKGWIGLACMAPFALFLLNPWAEEGHKSGDFPQIMVICVRATPFIFAAVCLVFAKWSHEKAIMDRDHEERYGKEEKLEREHQAAQAQHRLEAAQRRAARTNG